QDAQVFAEARPEKTTVLVLSEPVDVEDPGRVLQPLAELEPVAPVVAEVVAAERLHRHGIAPHDTDLTGGCRPGLRRRARPDEHAVRPALCLVDERCQRAPTTAEYDGGDRHALRIFHRR